MADYLPQATGNWSTTTWITAFSNLTAFAGGNTPPTFIDDVYADGKTLYVDINTAVNTIRTTTTPRTGGLAGGSFILNNSLSLSANCLAGTTTCLQFISAAPNSATLVGNISGSLSTGVGCCVNSSTGALNVFGNIQSGNVSSSVGITNSSTGTVNIIGTVRSIDGQLGSSNGANGISNSGTIFLTGNCIGGGGTPSNAVGIVNVGNNSTTTVFGNISGGNSTSQNPCVGIINSGVSTTINVVGNIFAPGPTNGFSYGIQNNSSTGVVNIREYLWGAWFYSYRCS
jgi:hypothetical protein